MTGFEKADARDRAALILDKINGYSLYFMIFFIPISISAIEALFILSLTCFILKNLVRPDLRHIAKDAVSLSLLSFFAFSALSLLNSGPYLAKSLSALFFKWAEYLMIFFIMRDVINKPERVRNAVIVLLISAGLIGLDAVFQKITGYDLFRHRELIVGRTTAAFKVTNSLAAYLVPIIILESALLIFGSIKKRYKYILVLSTILLTMVLIFTFSRAGWVGFISGSVLLLLLTRDIRKTSVPIILFAVFLLTVPSLRDRVTAHGDAQRVRFFSATARMIRENPFLGKGVGTYMHYFNRYCPDKNPSYAHNSYMQIWAETGIFSFLSFIAFLAALFIRGVRAFLGSDDLILGGLICGVFGFLVHAFFDNHFYSVQLSFLFWFLAGLISARVQTNSALATVRYQ